MSTLICKDCKQIPYIEFLPGLYVKIMCCKTLLIKHTDIDKFMESNYTLKCEDDSCFKSDSDTNYFANKIICDKCMKKYNSKNFIKSDIIPNICLEHKKTYQYYDSETHRLFCEYCKRPQSAESVEDYKRSISINKISISEDSLTLFPYYINIGKRIMKSYEITKKKSSFFNCYLSLLNLKQFFDDYPIISPICQICKEIYNINIKEDDNENILEISCKCEKNSLSLKEFENKIDSITCEKCKNVFKQIDMFQDLLSQDTLCEKCLYEKNIFDYIRFKEIPYICSIHKKNFNSYCNLCGKLFCRQCINSENDNIIKIKDDQVVEKKYSILNDSNWFLKLKKKGFLNLKNSRKFCGEHSKDIIKEFYKLKVEIEKKEQNDLKELSNDLKFDLFYYFNKINNFSLKVSNYLSRIKIYDLENQVNKLTTLIKMLFKEFCDKSKIVQFVKTRNILQHLLANMIKNNYDCFEEINSDFRILYESYKYLNYEKKNTEQIKEKLESIFERAEILVKNQIKRKVKEKLCSQFLLEKEEKKLNVTKEIIENYFNSSDNEKQNFNKLIENIVPRVPNNEKIEIFNRVFDNPIKREVDNIKFSTIDLYDKFLLNHKAFTPGFLNKKHPEIIGEIENIKANEINFEYQKKEVYKKLNLIGDTYFDKFGYVNENTFNKNIIKEVFDNNYKNGNYHYLLLKNKRKKLEEFLKNVHCKNDAEFYFIFILSNKLINRIGRIIHQNDAIFQFLFYDPKNNFDINNYNLIKDKEKGEIKFSINNDQNKINSLKNLTQEELTFSSIIKFINDFEEINLPKVQNLLGEAKIKEIKNEIINKYQDINEIDNIKNEINLLENKIAEFTLFINNYKELFILFPKLNENIQQIIGKNDTPLLFEKKNYKYTEKKEDNSFIYVFSDMYALIIYLTKVIKNIRNIFQKQNEQYDDLLNKYYKLELSKIVFNLLEKSIDSENNLIDYFDEEKKNTIIEIDNFFGNSVNNSLNLNYISYLSQGKKDILEKMKNEEIKKFHDASENLKGITLKELGSKFEKYFDYDINSFADTKFDVLLFLCQNDLI